MKFSKGKLPSNFLLRGSFSNFGYLNESRESPIVELEISRSDFEESIEGLSFCVLEDDLITSMSNNCLLTERLTKFYSLVYWEGQSSWDCEYLLFKQRLWEIQARKMIIKEGLEWWFLDRISKNDIFTTRF